MPPSSEPLATREFATRALLLLAFVLPLEYASDLVGDAIHEILGHGLAACVAGGRFQGFVVQLDGHAHALIRDGGHPYVVLAAGVVVSVVLAVWLLLMAPRLRSHALLSLAMLVFAADLLENNLAYGFWGSWDGQPRSDFGEIVAASGDPSVQHALIAVFGVAWVVGTYAWNRLVFRWIEDHLGPLTMARSILSILMLGSAVSALRCLHDSNPFIPGANATPQIVGTALKLTIGLSLLATRRADVERRSVSRRAWGTGIAASWLLVGALIAAVALWLRHGVSW